MVSLSENQANKQLVWEFWNKIESASDDELQDIVNAVTSGDINWHAPAPIDLLANNQSFVDDYLIPLRRSFRGLKRESHIFMGGESSGKADGSRDGRNWVGGTGYLRGVFESPWLGIPATNKEVAIRWGEFCLVENGAISEVYFLLDLVDLLQQAGIEVLPPARGQDHIYPPPINDNAVFLAEQDEAATEKSMQLIRDFLYDGLNAYDQSDLESMGVAKYFEPDVQWYGPGGIGACLSLKEFEDLHQVHWLHAFPDREVQDLDNLFAEGDYVGSSGWNAVKATHAGEYLGCPATDNTIYTNGIDFWRRRGDKYIENWVFVDMVHLFRQFGVDLLKDIPSTDA